VLFPFTGEIVPNCPMRDKETKLVKAVHDQKTKVMKAAPRQKRGRFSLSSLGKKKWGAIPPSWKGMPSDRPLYDQETKIIKAIRPSKSRPTKKGLHFSLSNLIHKRHQRRVRPSAQMSKVECGLTCLAMILTYYGRKTSVSELRTRFGIGRDGTSALGIVKVARSMGMRVRPLSLQHTQLRGKLLPAIVHWEFNHFLIVERWSPKWVTVVDPAGGQRRRLTAEEFDAGFTGIFITLEPGANFDRNAPRSPVTLSTYIFQGIKQAPGALLQILVASIVLQLFGLVTPFVTKVIIDQILPFKISNMMAILALGMAFLFTAQTITTLLREWLLVYLRARIDMHMMLGFFKHLLSLPYNYFQQRSSGDLLTRMGSNTAIRDILSSNLIGTLLDSSMVITYLFILLSQSLPFTVLTLIIGFSEMLLVILTYRPIRELSRQELNAQGKSQGYLAEALNGIATVKAAGAEQEVYNRWSKHFFDQLSISVRRSYFSSLASAAMSVLGTFSSIAMLWVGAVQVLNGSMSVGTMLALNALAGSFLGPLSSVVGRAQQVQMVQANLERLTDITAAEPEQHQQVVQSPPKLSGHVQLENVCFRYSSDGQDVLGAINLTIKAGQKVAIVGRTGSGKSTLGKLLLGLYLPTRGTIKYDGIPLQRMQYQEVRRQFGVVMQDSVIFSGTILDNLTLNNPKMSREQAMYAAQIAAIHEDIMKMPMGYDTFVGEGGSALSGGQRQRMAIARAVAHNPVMLLLDEATSSLDVITEQRVAEHLESFACTQIIIAHRLSTIRKADVILVLDGGMIVEQGKHDELLHSNGYYSKLIQQQLQERNRSKSNFSRVDLEQLT
jgi:ATP-binding cassette subfamily B protein